MTNSFSTPDLYDEYIDSVQVLSPILKNFGGREKFCGEIVTVKCFEDNSVVKAQVAEPGLNRVLVVDGGGSLRCALLGDLLAQKAVDSGWSGILIYGCIRDVDEIRKMPIGVQAIASIPKKSVRKNRGDLNIDVDFGGVLFKPGAFLYADNNGVLVSPNNLLSGS